MGAGYLSKEIQQRSFSLLGHKGSVKYVKESLSPRFLRYLAYFAVKGFCFNYVPVADCGTSSPTNLASDC